MTMEAQKAGSRANVEISDSPYSSTVLPDINPPSTGTISVEDSPNFRFQQKGKRIYTDDNYMMLNKEALYNFRVEYGLRRLGYPVGTYKSDGEWTADGKFGSGDLKALDQLSRVLEGKYGYPFTQKMTMAWVIDSTNFSLGNYDCKFADPDKHTCNRDRPIWAPYGNQKGWDKLADSHDQLKLGEASFLGHDKYLQDKHAKAELQARKKTLDDKWQKIEKKLTDEKLPPERIAKHKREFYGAGINYLTAKTSEEKKLAMTGVHKVEKRLLGPLSLQDKRLAEVNKDWLRVERVLKDNGVPKKQIKKVRESFFKKGNEYVQADFPGKAEDRKRRVLEYGAELVEKSKRYAEVVDQWKNEMKPALAKQGITANAKNKKARALYAEYKKLYFEAGNEYIKASKDELGFAHDSLIAIVQRTVYLYKNDGREKVA